MTEIASKPGATFLKYKPQVSGLRFCAVAFVVLYHYSTTLESFKRIYDLGNLIVFFFVLSSYLITKILLKAKKKAEASGVSMFKVTLAFLGRRTLRIFPAHYLYLLVLFLLPLEGKELREHLWVYLLYLTNFLIFFTKTAGQYTVHLWTLAVEEQFYIIWPWLILFIPTRYLPRVLMVLIVLAVAFRVCFSWFLHQGGFEMWVLTPACLDSFALGALIAYYHSAEKKNVWLRRILFIAVPIWIWLIFSNHQKTFLGLNRLFISLVAIVLIDQANQGFRGITGRILESRVVQYLAKISFGIYLYHLIASAFYWKAFDALSVFFAERGIDLTGLRNFTSIPWVSFIIYASISVLCASISWYLLEQPLNNLRRLVVYVMKGRKEALPTATQVVETVKATHSKR